MGQRAMRLLGVQRGKGRKGKGSVKVCHCLRIGGGGAIDYHKRHPSAKPHGSAQAYARRFPVKMAYGQFKPFFGRLNRLRSQLA